MASKSEQGMASDNGMSLTHPSHLNVNKRIVAEC